MTESILTYLANESNDLYIQRHYKDNIEKHYKLSRQYDNRITYLDLIKFKEDSLDKKSMFLLKNGNLVLEVTPKKGYVSDKGVNAKKIVEAFSKGVDATKIFELDAYSFSVAGVFDKTSRETSFRKISKELCRRGIISLGIIPFVPLGTKEINMEEIALTCSLSEVNIKAKKAFEEYREYQTLDNWERVKVFL